MRKPPAQHWRKNMTDLRNKIIGLLTDDLCYRADRKADAIIALVIKEYEEFVFAIATKVSQREARISELEHVLSFIGCSDNAEGKLARKALEKRP
jgi:hypothetical protein